MVSQELKKLLPFTMREGVLNTELSLEIVKWIALYPNDPKWDNLKQVMNNMHHVNTYYDKESEAYRTQGYINIKDLPDEIPEQLTDSTSNLAIKNNSIVVEVWSMWLRMELPF
jgi:hypothetical protein